MTRVRQNAAPLPKFRNPNRPHAEREAATIRAMARGGQSLEAIALKLRADGFERSENSIRRCKPYTLGAAERREARAREAEALSAARRERAYDHRAAGIRNAEFPGITLPRVSIQMGCASFPQAWGS